MAIQIFAFVDNFLSGAKSREEAAEASAQVKGDLECSGFIVCPEKKQWHPVQKGEHLGYCVDLQSGVISVPAVSMQKLEDRIASLLDTGATARKIACITGTVISMGLALGPVARLWTRSLYYQIKLWKSWDRKIELTPESMCELHF